MQIVDEHATTWYINTGAFRLPDPTTGHIFESGEKYLIEQSEWMKGQPTIVETTMKEEVEVQEPKQPKGPRIDRSEGFVESAPAKKG